MSSPDSTSRIGRFLRGSIEAILLILVVFAPWAFGSVHPLALAILYSGIGICLLLWCIILLIEGAPTVLCPVAVTIALMVLLGLWQVTPLPESVLSVLAPGSARQWAFLVPQQPEVIEGHAGANPARTISLYPHATRDQVLKLLAVLAVFLLTRYAVASSAALKRFAIAAVMNGVFLSLFALVQSFSSPVDRLYWTFDSTGAVFGPFICRNHFPFQVNLCIGLGLGLLLTRVPKEDKRKSKSKARFNDEIDWKEKFLKMAKDPAAPWIACSLGLMIAAGLLSQSRGGLLALVMATVICLVFRLLITRDKQGDVWPALLLVGGVVFAFVAWFGMSKFEKRLQTIWSGDALADGRARLWERSLPIAADFPIWGAGYATYDFLETTRRAPSDATQFRFEFAHNDYLQTLIEGGVVHLLLVLLAIVLIYRHAFRAIKHATRSSTTALVLGGMIGLTTVTIHSFGDFGLHIPSITLMTAMLAGLLVGLGKPNTNENSAGFFRRGLGVALAMSFLLLAVLLPVEGWRTERAEQLRLASLRARTRLQRDERQPIIEYLSAAVQYSPGDALLWLMLAETQRGMYETHENDPKSLQNYLYPALHSYQRARNANPLLVEPHLWLGLYGQHLTSSDSPETYLRRAVTLTPSDARAWYLAGVLALREQKEAQAWTDWRWSLQCSLDFLPDILRQIVKRADADSVFMELLPDDGRILQAVAAHPLSEKVPKARQNILQRALNLASPEPDPESRYRRGWLLREMEQFDEAIAEYRIAVDLAPNQLEWRFELANLYYDAGRFEEAAQELRRILERNPQHTRTKELQKMIIREKVAPKRK